MQEGPDGFIIDSAGNRVKDNRALPENIQEQDENRPPSYFRKMATYRRLKVDINETTGQVFVNRWDFPRKNPFNLIQQEQLNKMGIRPHVSCERSDDLTKFVQYFVNIHSRFVNKNICHEMIIVQESLLQTVDHWEGSPKITFLGDFNRSAEELSQCNQKNSPYAFNITTTPRGQGFSCNDNRGGMNEKNVDLFVTLSPQGESGPENY